MRRLALLSFLLTLAAGPAAAHAQLVAAEPAEGAVLPSAPQTVVLTFDEPVTPLVFRWLGPDGAVRELAARSEGRRVLVPVPPVGRGSQLLSWRVVSSDGHPVGGACSFAIGASSATAVTARAGRPDRRRRRGHPGTAHPPARLRRRRRRLRLRRRPRRPGPRLDPQPRPRRRLAAVPAAALALLAHGCDLLGSFHPRPHRSSVTPWRAPSHAPSRSPRWPASSSRPAAAGPPPSPPGPPRRSPSPPPAIGHRPAGLADHHGDGAARRSPPLLARRPAADRRLGRLRPPGPRARARRLFAARAPSRRPPVAERRRPRHHPARTPRGPYRHRLRPSPRGEAHRRRRDADARRRQPHAPDPAPRRRRLDRRVPAQRHRRDRSSASPCSRSPRASA